jgi:hypothetical protein
LSERVAPAFGVFLEDRFDRHPCCHEQLTQWVDVDVGLDELADDLSKVCGSQDRTLETGGDEVGAGLLMEQSHDGGGVQNRYSAAASRRSLSSLLASDRALGNV